ncbi:MAG TPA: 2-amino-4-hydroxy-6-hydroxymethyldihydropteridine diphosphokinase [Syntrophorhabdaceae bacterium]|nr:2-amino-4-hydroxy-6-hydroxymethyldihydropteridine diphosphokinase [Pseudomonadota bacterium]HNZ59684.1 2-amino-4-hydroxy-6-hydroxymethyldihydropteridine diphosphokinase [Syntrophorhabdaceae bacterium]HOB70009.1 2-amino-4-hydroxy-6-hydroxymethyldihydropteridine diphosphokinase [Syntrophorhabdaceae bacterium]HOF58763.1 2-amino-4-hydroxy-6-hydroxymethyldihydropteridine diphosphokinase [Syntrophorhabdaceae bacterium]HOG39937.1 2-amino-4-hydroxy-6-hydroxymethyldihydropteridine diphosphokinase [Sy
MGSNLGNSQKNCLKSIDYISKNPRITRVVTSSLYITSPVSNINQNDFINCAISIDWESDPIELLDYLQSIEHDMGRTRKKKNEPRIIDLDILLFSNLVLNTPRLIVPHPELHKRRFAIIPCIEIDPHIVHPFLKRPLIDFLDEIDEKQTCKKLPLEI